MNDNDESVSFIEVEDNAAETAPPFVLVQFMKEMPESVSEVEIDVNSNAAPLPDDRVMLLTFTSVVMKVPEPRSNRGEVCEMDADEMEREVRVSAPVERRNNGAPREEAMETENVLSERVPPPTLNIV